LGAGVHVQFERLGYFFTDPKDHADERVFNQTIGLKDSWTKKPGRRPPEEPPAAKEKPGREPREYSADVQSRIDAMLAAHDLPRQEATGLALSPSLSLFFEDMVADGARPRAAASWVLSEVRSVLEGEGLEPLRFGPAEIVQLISLVESGVVSNRHAKEVFTVLSTEGGRPAEIVDQLGLQTISDSASLEAAVDRVLADNPDSVERFRGGEKRLQGFFMGQVMRAMEGKADAREVSQILARKLRD